MHKALHPTPSGAWRRPAHLLGVFVTTMFLFWLTFISANLPIGKAQEENQATVIVQFDQQAHVVRRVAFTQPISGLVALQWSGLRVITAATGFGPAVCSIEGVGCPATNCFCDAQRFWAYSYWDGSGWQSYPVSAASSVISQTGAIEGWRWGEFGDPQTPAPQSLAAAQALTWLGARQSITNGGYGGVGAAVETMLALGANGLTAAEWRRSVAAPSVQAYVAVQGAAFSRNSAGGAGKLALAVAAADTCLPGGAVTPRSHYSPTLGAYSKQSGPNSLAILGAVAISESVPTAASGVLKGAQQATGGWEWAPGWGADTNATALAVQALVATGEPISSSTIISALTFLQSAQQRDGGFAYDLTPNAPSDANSTAYVVQALLAAGENPTGGRWTISATTPISYLLGLQLADGSLQWQTGLGANQLATQQAIPALFGRAHPIARRTVPSCPALYLPLAAKR